VPTSYDFIRRSVRSFVADLAYAAAGRVSISIFVSSARQGRGVRGRRSRSLSSDRDQPGKSTRSVTLEAEHPRGATCRRDRVGFNRKSGPRRDGLRAGRSARHDSPCDLTGHARRLQAVDDEAQASCLPDSRRGIQKCRKVLCRARRLRVEGRDVAENSVSARNPRWRAEAGPAARQSVHAAREHASATTRRTCHSGRT